MTTGEKIKKLRKQLGMTQEELGAKIGVQKAAINKYETGIVVNLKKSTLSSLARALNVSPIDLLGSEEDGLFPDEEQLLSGYRSLSPRGKDLLLDRCEELKVLYGKKPEDPAAKSI